MVIIPSTTQTRMTPFRGHLTLKFPFSNCSLLWIELVSNNTTTTGTEEGRSRRGTETSASGARESRWFVVTSIWIFKYLTEQISRRPGDTSPRTQVPFLTARRQPASKPILKRARQFVPFKDTSSHFRYSGRQIKFLHEGQLALFFPALFDFTVWSSDYLPSVLMAAPTWTQHYHHNYF